MKRSKLAKNAAILTLTGFLLRALGMGLRVYISKRLGEEGMGLYQLVQTVYFLFITVAQSGIAVAMTRALSSRVAVGDKRGAEAVTRSALILSVMLGTLSAVTMSALSVPICRYWLGDMRCAEAVALQGAALPFIAVCTVLSSYFIVYGNATAGCVSQIIEQLVRVGCIALSGGATLVKIVLAGVVAEGVSCAFLYICYLIKKRPRARADCKKELVTAALPIAASRYLASGLRTVENVLVPNAITAFTKDRALSLSQFGALKGMAIPLLFFPYSFLSAITTLIVPRVTGAQATRDKAALKKTTERVCFVTLAFSVVAAGVFFTFADTLGQLIYKSDRVTAMILWLAPIVPFMYLDSVCDGLLKGLGKQKEVLWHNTLDSALRILLILVLVPFFGVQGFLAVMVVSNVFISIINLHTLSKETGMTAAVFRGLITPISATFCSSTLTNFLFKNRAITLNFVAEFVLFCVFFGIFFAILTVIKKFCKN